MRIALALALSMLAYISVVQTLVYGQRYGDVERVYALWPHDGRVSALLARKLAGAGATPGYSARADVLAHIALRQDPTAVIAVATLGFERQLKGDTAHARRLFDYAQFLSRRDLQTQLWTIEDAVTRGDVKGALRHYDIALRTQRGARDLLYPVMAAAVVDPNVRSALVQVLAAKPVWGAFFIDFVSGNGRDAPSTARLFLALRSAGVAISTDANATIVNMLATRNSFDLAWNYYAAIHPGVNRDVSRNPRFTGTGTPSLFDWTLINNLGAVVSIQREKNGGVLDFTVPTGSGGTLVQQTQILKQGRYRLTGHSDGISQLADARPYWVLTCNTSGRELGRVEMTNSSDDKGLFVGIMDVPADCPVQVLSLAARSSDTVLGLSGRIDYVELRLLQPTLRER